MPEQRMTAQQKETTVRITEFFKQQNVAMEQHLLRGIKLVGEMKDPPVALQRWALDVVLWHMDYTAGMVRMRQLLHEHFSDGDIATARAKEAEVRREMGR